MGGVDTPPTRKGVCTHYVDKSHICVKIWSLILPDILLALRVFRALCDCTNVLQEANLLKQKKISHRAIIYYDGLSSSLAECPLFIH